MRSPCFWLKCRCDTRGRKSKDETNNILNRNKKFRKHVSAVTYRLQTNAHTCVTRKPYGISVHSPSLKAKQSKTNRPASNSIAVLAGNSFLRLVAISARWSIAATVEFTRMSRVVRHVIFIRARTCVCVYLYTNRTDRVHRDLVILRNAREHFACTWRAEVRGVCSARDRTRSSRERGEKTRDDKTREQYGNGLQRNTVARTTTRQNYTRSHNTNNYNIIYIYIRFTCVLS